MVERGGDQGDYRAGMQAKIRNAIDCEFRTVLKISMIASERIP
jgi:hypothetical protein